MKLTAPLKKSIVYPPGNRLDTAVTVTPIGYLNLVDDEKYKQPLPTLSEAIRREDNLRITVTAVVLINTTIQDPQLVVSQVFIISNDGKPQLQFFIHCTTGELSRLILNPSGKCYNAFKVEFTTNNTTGFPVGSTEILPEGFFSGEIKMKDIEYVQTFLWNIDPKTSRGTVTTVQSTVPGNS